MTYVVGTMLTSHVVYIYSYRCFIATFAVHDDNDVISVRESVYVGLYATVTFTKTRTTSTQQGLCIPDGHVVSVSVDAPSTSASIGVGQMLAGDDITMLRAYTTYSITVVAESDVRGSSEGSEPITITTAQTSK